MDDLLYGIGAVFFGMLMGYSMLGQAAAVSKGVDENHIRGQISGVAEELFEELANRPFDASIIGSTTRSADLPAHQFTPARAFGGTCNIDIGCADLDDYHGQTRILERESLKYTVRIEVRYVDEDDPTVVSYVPTFAKEVILRITTTHLRHQREPVVMVLGRVYTYHA